MSEVVQDPLQVSHQNAIEAIVSGRGKYDEWLLRWSDILNPILVKETRQALKSRQFTWTFALLLIAVIVWTILGITLMIPGIYFMASGAALLCGYFLVLLVPVGIVVPFAAFRSMAAELEQGTFEILSISSLTPRQIVVGKLTVAVLQAVIYFSALAPCIALTYLLRGLPIQLIAIVLGGTALISLMLSTLAILFASLGRNRVGQVGLMLVLMLIVFPANIAWASTILSLIGDGSFPDDWEAWALLAVVVGFCLSYAWLGIQAAAARIGFAADNHSTGLRWTLLLQQFAFVWFFTTIQVMYEPDEEIWIAMFVILGIHWAIAGSLMIGEQGVISPRARRSLPKSIETRQLLTWFNPGSGTGYVFAVLSYAAAVIYFCIVSQMKWSLNEPIKFETYGFAIMCLGYLTMYLGITRLIMLVIGRFVSSRMVTSVTLVAILIVFGALIPLFASYWIHNFRTATYEAYMFPNLFWSLIEIDDSIGQGALFLLGITAAIVFQVNLLFLTRDVMLVRIEVPPRVRQERNEGQTEAETPVDPLAI